MQSTLPLGYRILQGLAIGMERVSTQEELTEGNEEGRKMVRHGRHRTQITAVLEGCPWLLKLLWLYPLISLCLLYLVLVLGCSNTWWRVAYQPLQWTCSKHYVVGILHLIQKMVNPMLLLYFRLHLTAGSQAAWDGGSDSGNIMAD